MTSVLNAVQSNAVQCVRQFGLLLTSTSTASTQLVPQLLCSEHIKHGKKPYNYVRIITRELGSSGPYAMLFCLDDLDKKSIGML